MHAPESLLVLLLTFLFLGLLVELVHLGHPAAPPKASRRGPRPLRPRTPDDCGRAGKPLAHRRPRQPGP